MSYVKWEAALRRQWEPLGHMPTNPAEAAALGLHHGLDAWRRGGRKALIEASVKGDRAAFVTLGCRDWPHDEDKKRLIRELQWVHQGGKLEQQTRLFNPVSNPGGALVGG